MTNPSDLDYDTLREMPVNVLANRVVEALIQTNGNLNLSQMTIEMLIREMRKESDVADLKLRSQVKELMDACNLGRTMMWHDRDKADSVLRTAALSAEEILECTP